MGLGRIQYKDKGKERLMLFNLLHGEPTEKNQPKYLRHGMFLFDLYARLDKIIRIAVFYSDMFELY